MEYFDASHQFIRQRRSVWCDDWSIVFAGFTRRIFLLIRLSRIFERLSGRFRSLYGTSSRAECSRSGSNNRLREELAAITFLFLVNYFWLALAALGLKPVGICRLPLGADSNYRPRLVRGPLV